MARSFRGDRLVAARRETPIVFLDLLNGYSVAVRAFFTGGPLREQVGNVIGRNFGAFVVQAKAVGGEVIEPDALGLPPLLEDERRRCHARIRPEDAAGETHHGLQVAVGEEELAQTRGGIRGTE